MSWTKRQLVDQALTQIGIASYTYDLSPDMLQSALRQLDAMMAGWYARGHRLKYPLPSSPELSDLTEESNVQDWAVEAIFLNLAIRLAPSYGKQASPDLRIAAREAFQNMVHMSTKHPPERQFPTTLPVGSGYKYTADMGGLYFTEPDEELMADEDEELEF